MTFHAGDQVVHRAHGPGVVVELDEKVLSGRTAQYYVFQVRDLTLYIPVNENQNSSLRWPTPADEFEQLFAILSSPAEPISSDRLERKSQLGDRIKDGRLDSICHVIRDLSYYRRAKKLSDSDQSILERAQTFLLSEWQLCLSVPLEQAEGMLNQLLEASFTRSLQPLSS